MLRETSVSMITGSKNIENLSSFCTFSELQQFLSSTTTTTSPTDVCRHAELQYTPGNQIAKTEQEKLV